MRELVIAFCAAVGTDLGKVQTELTKCLQSAKVSIKPIRASQLIRETAAGPVPEKQNEADRIDFFMNAGNAIRRKVQSGDAVARMIIAKIRENRKTPDVPDRNTVYIVSSLKHPDEYKTLSKLYGDAFVMISVYEPKEDRKQALCKSIAETSNSYDPTKHADRAEELIAKDQEESDPLGQSVRDTFPLADIFISASNAASNLQRVVDLMLGHPFVSPTRDEYGMFHAFSAARRSSDLSRQVGAVVANDRGDIVAMGCNEVPRIGGGSYWEDENRPDYDRRDFRLGWDQSAAFRKEIITEVIAEVRAEGWLPDEYDEMADSDVAEHFINTGKGLAFKGKRISSILEYGRIVHAELSALMDSARRGVSVSGHSLFCTTFPCHMCARHIIASGLLRVVYIEPYPKSLAKRLYEKEISVDGDLESLPGAVKFEPFVGIAPKHYMAWFEFERRKNDKGYADKTEIDLSKRKVAVRDVDRSNEEAILIAELSKLENKNER